MTPYHYGDTHGGASVAQVTKAGFLGIMRAEFDPIQAFDWRNGRKDERAQGRGVTSRHRRLAVLRGVPPLQAPPPVPRAPRDPTPPS